MLSVNNRNQDSENENVVSHSFGQKTLISNQRMTRARAALDDKINTGQTGLTVIDLTAPLKNLTNSIPENQEEKRSSLLCPSKSYIQSRDSLREELLNSASDQTIFTTIDEEDADNDLMMTYYVNEIFDYLCVRELTVLPLHVDFLEKAKAKFTPRMRYILVDWIVQVSVKFQLLPETVYLAVAILDRIFQIKGSVIEKKDLQLVGISALYIASKYEEIYPPEIADFVFVTDDAFKEQQIRCQELDILETLDFYLSIPLPIIFLRRFSRLSELDTAMHSSAKYFLELTMQEYNLCYLPANVRAAASVTLAIQLFSTLSPDVKSAWTVPLQFHSGLKPEDLAPVIKTIAGAAFRQHADSKFRAIYKKYKEEDSGAISITPQMSSDLIRQIGGC